MSENIVELSGYSDDCASITGINDSEYDVPGRWYAFFVDGVVIGKIRITYDDREWKVEIKSDQHELKVVKGE